MPLKIKVVPKDNGDEPKVKDEQAAPIVGETDDLPWEEGTVNEGHADLPEPPKADLPPPPPSEGEEDGTSGGSISGDSPQSSDDLPEPPAVDDESGAVGSAPDADNGQLPESHGELPEPPPTELGETAPEQIEGDEPQQESGTVEEAVEEMFETVNDGVVTTDTEMKSHGETVSTNHEAEPVGQPVTGQIARVSYACGFTKNIGEFNSMRAEVKIELPCAVENVEQTYDEAVAFVDARLQKLWDDAG